MNNDSIESISVSKRSLSLAIGTEITIKCDLRRHLSPRTVGIITRSLPIRGNAHTLGNDIIYIETSIDSGMERARNQFARGDVAFLPSTGSICFFLRDVHSTKKMTPLGRLVGYEDHLTKIKPGTVLSIHETI